MNDLREKIAKKHAQDKGWWIQNEECQGYPDDYCRQACLEYADSIIVLMREAGAIFLMDEVEGTVRTTDCWCQPVVSEPEYGIIPEHGCNGTGIISTPITYREVLEAGMKAFRYLGFMRRQRQEDSNG